MIAGCTNTFFEKVDEPFLSQIILAHFWTVLLSQILLADVCLTSLLMEFSNQDGYHEISDMKITRYDYASILGAVFRIQVCSFL